MQPTPSPTHQNKQPGDTKKKSTGSLPSKTSLAPVAVLPEQFFHAPHSSSAAGGEIALIQAVLQDALNCFQKQFISGDRRTRRIAKEAEEWFFTDDYQWPFSFVNVCAHLGLDPDYIRKELKQVQTNNATKSAQKRPQTEPFYQPSFQVAA